MLNPTENKKLIAFCFLCDWNSISKGHNYKSFKIKNESASEVLYGKLYQHFEEHHIDMIMEIWMSNQASRNIVDFEERNFKCEACSEILAKCFCVEPKIKTGVQPKK